MASDESDALYGEWKVTLDDTAESAWEGDSEDITAAAVLISRVAPKKGDAARVVLGALAGFAGLVLSVDGDVAVVRAHLDRHVKVLPLDCLTLDRSA